MASRKLTTTIRHQLYSFAKKFASLFTDSRRRRFIQDMVVGLVAAGHVHLTAVARALSNGAGNLHATEKRLSGHLASTHWDLSPVADRLLEWSAARVTDDSLIVADLTDLAKPHAKKLEGLARVHDGSDPHGRIVPGYCIFEAHVRVRKWQLFPLAVEPLKVYSGASTSENAELLREIFHIHEAAGGKGTWMLDRGFDRRGLFQPLVKRGVAFVVRQRGDRLVRTADGKIQSVDQVVAGIDCPKRERWPQGGVATTVEVWLPEVSDRPFLLVVGWRYPRSGKPLVLLVSPDARRPQRTARWFVTAYLRRWGIEDATRGLKQQFKLELFLVRSWRSIRRLLWLVAVAFWWLNLWGDEKFRRLRDALMSHPWRLRKRVVYLFNWLANLLRRILHPPPSLVALTGCIPGRSSLTLR